MKKQMASILSLALALVLVGCGKAKPEEYAKKVWTASELEQVKGDKAPQPDTILVVARGSNENDSENSKQAGESLLQLVEGLAGLDTQAPQGAYAGYGKVMQELEMERFPFSIQADPNQADILLEYELSYPSAGKFKAKGKMVEALGCKLKLKARRGEQEIATVEVTHAPENADDLPENAEGEVKMSPPDLSKGVYAEKMLKFFQQIQGE